MADQLNINGLNLNGDSDEQRSYIPPHMRGKIGGSNSHSGQSGSAPILGGGLSTSSWSNPDL